MQLAVKAARESLIAAIQAREAANAQRAADQSGAQDVQAQFTVDAARAQLVAALGRTS